MPRILETKRCPHCGAEIEPPTPRTCPHCMGSLQMRYLRAGCLSSAPPLLLVGLGLWALAGRIAPREPHAERSPTPPAAAEELALERADTGSESGAGRALPGR